MIRLWLTSASNTLILILLHLSCLDEPKLVGFWPLSETHGGRDLSGYGNNINLHDVLYEEACDSCSKVVYFKGTGSSYGVIPGGGVLDVQKSFTWMAWVYPESLQSGPLFDWNHDFGNHWETHIWVHENTLFMNMKGMGSDTISTQAPATKEWNKLAVSFRYSTGDVGFYVNGKIQWLEDQFKQGTHHTFGNINIGVR